MALLSLSVAFTKPFTRHSRLTLDGPHHHISHCVVCPHHRTPYTAPPSFMKLLSSAGIQLLLLLHLFFDLSAKTDALEYSQSPSIRCREPWMCVYPNGYNRKPKVWRKYAQHKWRMEIHLIMAFRNRRQENETIFGYMQTERERMRGDQHRQLGRRTLHQLCPMFWCQRALSIQPKVWYAFKAQRRTVKKSSMPFKVAGLSLSFRTKIPTNQSENSCMRWYGFNDTQTEKEWMMARKRTKFLVDIRVLNTIYAINSSKKGDEGIVPDLCVYE